MMMMVVKFEGQIQTLCTWKNSIRIIPCYYIKSRTKKYHKELTKRSKNKLTLITKEKN